MQLLSTSVCAAVALAALAIAQDRGGGRPAPSGGSPPSGGDQPRSGRDAAPAGRDRPAVGGDRGARGDEPKPAPPSDADLAQQYFKTSDYDANGWIIFSEAQSALNVDRKGFGVFDLDNDGRISAEEFTTRFHSVKERGGAFPPPIPNPDARSAKKRTAAELLDAFDGDKDGGLDEREIARALADYGVTGVEAAPILVSVDKDGSKEVEASEAQALLDVLAPPSAAEASKKKATSFAELFDQNEVRRPDRDQTPQPPRILGPVTTFRRLDFDQSGAISVEDLDALQRPLQLPVRVRAVLAALDTDGDGTLSAEELDAALK